jgi:hypothetical protein
MVQTSTSVTGMCFLGALEILVVAVIPSPKPEKLNITNARKGAQNHLFSH